MLPMMIGVMTASITSGRLIAKTGNYKPYPICGVAIMLIGGAAVGHDGRAHDDGGVSPARVLIAGLGMGQIGPSLTIIVQNAVDYRDLGVATAGFSFIRVAGRYGRLCGDRRGVRHTASTHLSPAMSVPGAPDPSQLRAAPSKIRELPEPVLGQVQRAFADSVAISARVVIPVLVVTLLVFVRIPNIPFRDTQR